MTNHPTHESTFSGLENTAQSCGSGGVNEMGRKQGEANGEARKEGCEQNCALCILNGGGSIPLEY